MSKKAIEAKLAVLRKKADMNEHEAQTARYRDDEQSAQYYSGVCAGYRMAALEIEEALRG